MKKKEEKIEVIKEKVEKNPEKVEKRRRSLHEKLAWFGSFKKNFLFSFIAAAFAGGIFFLFSRNYSQSFLAVVFLFFLFSAYFIVRKNLKKAAELKKMEDVFPDFIGLMASNLRAGMTIDKALLLSARKEFAPLDREIVVLGKDIVTGKEITQALNDAAARIKSDKIQKVMKLIISGIRSGGNLAVLLEETSQNMRERYFVEKRAASNVLMYVIFIFFAVAAGAPILFGLSSVLVGILGGLVSNLPSEQVVSSVPFALTSISVSTTFIFYFSLVFLVVTAILASLVLGLVSKGSEKEGLKYMLPLIVLSVTLFFLSRFVLLRYFSDLFA